MTWLLIVLGVAIVVSPLMWFRQSPRQKLITELRRCGEAVQGIQVTSATVVRMRVRMRHAWRAVCYRIPWLGR